MTHSSSDLPKEPVPVQHLACGARWEVYAIEWPAKLVVCPACHIALKLVGHDGKSKRVSYRPI